MYKDGNLEINCIPETGPCVVKCNDEKVCEGPCTGVDLHKGGNNNSPDGNYDLTQRIVCTSGQFVCQEPNQGTAGGNTESTGGNTGNTGGNTGNTGGNTGNTGGNTGSTGGNTGSTGKSTGSTVFCYHLVNILMVSFLTIM